MQENAGDMDLYHRICAGDTAALEGLIEQHRGDFTMFLYSIVHNRQDAEEIMVDAFAYLVASGDRYRGQATLKTYLFAIGRHIALRSRKKIKEIPLEPEKIIRLIQEPMDNSSAEDDCLKNQDMETLHSAISQLSVDYRQALTLVYFQGMTHRDAAQIMQKNVTQVTHLVARAKQVLCRLLKE